MVEDPEEAELPGRAFPSRAWERGASLFRFQRDRTQVHHCRCRLLQRLDRQFVSSRLVELDCPDLARLEVLEMASVLDGELERLSVNGYLNLAAALALAAALQHLH